MTDWKEQYLAALDARDASEKAHVELYNYCTKLADEKAILHQRITDKTEQPAAPPPPQPLIGYGIPRFTSPAPALDAGIVAQLRQDLSKAQQEREHIRIRLEGAQRELETLKTQSVTDTKTIAQLSASVSLLTRKLRDREEELRGKAKLIENVQDENVTLNLQLNVAEEQADKLKSENQDLVDRWMALKGDEARKMNEEGKFM